MHGLSANVLLQSVLLLGSAFTHSRVHINVLQKRVPGVLTMARCPWIRHEMDDFAGALDDFNCALELEHDDAWALGQRAITKCAPARWCCH